MAQTSSKSGKQNVASAKKSAASKTRKQVSALTKSNDPTPEQRYLMVQEAAYYHAQKAGFEGDSVEHWLAAEKEVEQRLHGG